MNSIGLYAKIRDRRVYIVEAYGQLDVWSVELDEPIGGTSSRKRFEREAKAAGWIATRVDELPARLTAPASK